MNITYYLGAGASANALPLVSTMNDRMQYFINALNQVNIEQKIEIEKDGPVQKKFQELLDQIRGHASIDTFAKKLHIKGKRKNLFLLKAFLSSYLVYEQMDGQEKAGLEHSNFSKFSSKNLKNEDKEELRSKVKTRLDYRYDSFFATLLDTKNLKLNEEISIISWNYDSQIEIGYSDFVGKSIHEVREDLNLFPNGASELNTEFSNTQIVKLNGVAGMHYSKESVDNKEALVEISRDGGSEIEYLEAILGYCKKMLISIRRPLAESGFPFVNFAWEINETGYQKKAFEEARNIIMKTDILIVIGYSFPTFNRNIDKRVLKDNKFQKVYIQAPVNDLEDYKQRLIGTLGQDFPENRIKLNSDLRQFLIPYELT